MSEISGHNYVLSVNGKVTQSFPLHSKMSVVGTERLISITSAGTPSLGRLASLPIAFPGNAGVETRYTKQLSVTAGGTVTAGKFVKLGTPDGDGNQRYVEFQPGDDATLNEGYCMEGGTENQAIVILSY